MKKHLNTLFVTTEGSYIGKEGGALVVRNDGKERFRVPIHMLSSVVCLGRVNVSAVAMALCAERGVGITYLTTHGRLLAKVTGFTSGNILLRKAQFRAAEEASERIRHARSFVVGKLYNTRVSLRRTIRDHGDPDDELGRAVGHIDRCLRRAGATAELEALRGIEGEGARQYFSVFAKLIRDRDGAFSVNGRSRRPPKDPVNAMLSFAYSLLASDTRTACEIVGLDPEAGLLHADRPGRSGLALDLMEEFRPVIADRVVLSLINRQQVKAADFLTEVGGAVRMMEKARKALLSEYQARKAEEIEHPFLQEKMTIGLLPLIQARLLAKAIRGELDAYPPYLWR